MWTVQKEELVEAVCLIISHFSTIYRYLTIWEGSRCAGKIKQ